VQTAGPPVIGRKDGAVAARGRQQFPTGGEVLTAIRLRLSNIFEYLETS
jgi:hypothetical protein